MKKGSGMNSVTKYVLGIVALAGAIFFSWYFFSVIVYILVAAVISFIGRPIIDLLGRVKIRGYRLPDGLKAGITVICLWGLFILFFRYSKASRSYELALFVVHLSQRGIYHIGMLVITFHSDFFSLEINY